MKLIYTPEDGERQVFDYEPTRLQSPDSEAIEEAGGPSWDDYAEFTDKLFGNNLKARRALLWIMLRHNDPKLRFVDVVVRVDQLKIALDVEDYRQVLDRDLTDEEREDIERELAEAFPETVEQPVGKDGPADTATGSPSLPPDSAPSPNNPAGM